MCVVRSGDVSMWRWVETGRVVVGANVQCGRSRVCGAYVAALYIYAVYYMRDKFR